MKAILVAVGAAALLSACASTNADSEPPVAAVDDTSPLFHPMYMRTAASSDMFEIESGRLALQRSQNPAVRQFAQMLIDHHTMTTNELMAAARAAGIEPPPPAMLPRHMEMLDRLRNAPTGEFDAAFKREQIMAHQEALMLHRNYAAQGDVPQLRDTAARAVPIIEGHLNHAQGLPEYAPAPAPAAPTGAGERGL